MRARDAWATILERISRENEWPEVVTEGVRFARAMCVQDSAEILVELLERGLEPNAWEPDQRVGMEAFEALVDLGGEARENALAAAAAALSNPGFKREAERALKRPPACTPHPETPVVEASAHMVGSRGVESLGAGRQEAIR